MREKQRVKSFIQDDIKAPIKRLIECGEIESAEILIYTRIDTMRHLTPSLFNPNDGDGDKYKKWVEQFMPLDYGSDTKLAPEELWVTRCDYVHNGGAVERAAEIRRIVLRPETAPEDSCEQNEVRVSMSRYVANFGISTRECYQWICAEESRLSDALNHLSKMKYVRIVLPKIGVWRGHSFENLTDENWQFFWDLGDQHVVECPVYLYNYSTGEIGEEDRDYLKQSIQGYANLYISDGCLDFVVETTGLSWMKDITDEHYTSEELFRMAWNDIDNWYRNSGAHNRFNVAAISTIRTRFCQHGRERQTGNGLHLYSYQKTPMIP